MDNLRKPRRESGWQSADSLSTASAVMVKTFNNDRPSAGGQKVSGVVLPVNKVVQIAVRCCDTILREIDSPERASLSVCDGDWELHTSPRGVFRQKRLLWIW
jgi:hypothetical protein